MSKHHFTFKEVFMFGWTKTVQHAWFVFLTFIIISIIISGTVLNPILNALVTLMATLSIASVSLMIVRNHAFSFADLFNPLLSPRRVLKFFALASFYVLPMLLVALTTAVLVMGAASGSASVTIFGLVMSLFFFIPSVYITVRFNFFPYIVAEHEHSSVKDLIMMSYKLTEDHFWQILAFLVLGILLNIAGVLLFGVGVLATTPITVFACAHLYDRLKSHTA
jgi:hypothetical protein